MPTVELIISGKVQGVFYRASTKEHAESLALTGWVRNLPDGSVQLRATGSHDALEKLEQWCRTGPPGAVVTALRRSILPEEAFSGFEVLR